jgi:hypothetical protein
MKKQEIIRVDSIFWIKAYNRSRRFVSKKTARNLVPDESLIYRAGAALLEGQDKIYPWYFVLINATPVIATTDTYSTHPGWTEAVNYDETTRQQWMGFLAATPGIITNEGFESQFTISSGGLILGGVGLVGGMSEASIKGNTTGGSGAPAILLSASALDQGNVTYPEGFILRVGCEQRTLRAA